MAGVTISAVQKWFGSTHVIRGVDIAIADGEFCVLVGPSGCGKSTLLRMIAGLEEIGEGTIAIGERVVNLVAPKERDIAMLFQNQGIEPGDDAMSALNHLLERDRYRAESARLENEAITAK